MINNSKATKSVCIYYYPSENDRFAWQTALGHNNLYLEGEFNSNPPSSIIRGKTGWDQYDMVHYQVFLTLSPASLDEPLPESLKINYQLSATNTWIQPTPPEYYISNGFREFHIKNRDYSRVTAPILVGEFVAQRFTSGPVFSIQKHDRSYFEANNLVLRTQIENFPGAKMLKLTKVGSYIGTLGCDELE